MEIIRTTIKELMDADLLMWNKLAICVFHLTCQKTEVNMACQKTEVNKT